jgi:hypothetical protein
VLASHVINAIQSTLPDVRDAEVCNVVLECLGDADRPARQIQACLCTILAMAAESPNIYRMMEREPWLQALVVRAAPSLLD